MVDDPFVAAPRYGCDMAHVFDQWTRKNPETNRRVRTDRWGHGKRWLARWDVDGVRDSKAFVTFDEAEDHLAQIRTGIIPTGKKATMPTVRQWVETWRTSQAHHRESSAAAVEDRARRVAETFGDTPIDELTRADVQAAVTQWMKSLKPRTIRATYSVLTGAMKLAMADGLVDASPCVGVKLPRAERIKVEPLTEKQVQAIAAKMPDRLRAMVWLGAASGMRGGEMRGLTVDRLSGTIVTVDRQLIRGSGPNRWGPTKSVAGNRVIDIGATATKVLKEHMKHFPPSPDGLIFTTAIGTSYTSKQASRYWRIAIEGMKLRPRSGWHDLRHHNASLLIAAGLSVRAVADRLGHADVSETLRTYAHLWPSDESRAVAAIEASLRPACDPGDAPDVADTPPATSCDLTELEQAKPDETTESPCQEPVRAA